MEQAREDGYVECTECGHPIEQHDMASCYSVPGCQCPYTWTQHAIRQYRIELGLPARWDHVSL